jgi:signal transduction histidine kinase
MSFYRLRKGFTGPPVSDIMSSTSSKKLDVEERKAQEALQMMRDDVKKILVDALIKISEEYKFNDCSYDDDIMRADVAKNAFAIVCEAFNIDDYDVYADMLLRGDK